MGATVEESGRRATAGLQGFNQRAAAFGAALGGATLLMGEFARAAAEDEASQARVEQSIVNTGAALDDYSGKLDVAIRQGQKKAFTDDQTRDAIVKLNLATNDTGKSLDNLSLAMDFARAKGVGLSTAAEVIGKVMGGNLGILTRYGIILDENATKEEALAAIQQRVSGQAQTYAATDLGKLDIYKDKINEITESWGAHAGAMQSVLLLLPGLQAGFVGLTAALGGVGGAGALMSLIRFLPPVAAGVTAAAGYNMVSNIDRPGGTAAERYLNQGIGLFGNVTGWGGASAFAQENLSRNSAELALAGAFYVPPGMNDEDTTSYLLGRFTSNGYGPPGNPNASDQDITNYINEEASALGMTVGQYIAFKFGAPDSGYVVDPVTGKFLLTGQYTTVQRERTIAAGIPGQGNVYGTGGYGLASTPRGDPYGGMGIYNPFQRTLAGGATPQAEGGFVTNPAYAGYAGGTGAIANSLSGAGAAPIVMTQENQDLANAANAAAYSAALREQYGAYALLIEGIDNAASASSAFKATQDGLLKNEGVYSQQIGEFTSQQNALTAGYEILLKRKEEGVKLTKQEQDLIDNYPELYERIGAGVDDATVSQSLLAAAYIENMSKSDSFKESVDGAASSISGMTDMVGLFILSLEGVPPEVRSRIILEMMGDGDLANLKAKLDALDGRVVTTTVRIVDGHFYANPSPVAQPGIEMPGFAHGGTVGIPFRGGEAGPEYFTTPQGRNGLLLTDGMYNLPRGSMVTPSGASKGRIGGGIVINGPITVIANDPQQFIDSIRESAIGSSR